MAERTPTSPGSPESTQVLAARHGAYYPEPPPDLQHHLELPPFADPEGIRNAYEAWCQLYESMTEEDEDPIVREKNQANLAALKAMRPAMENHADAVHLWRLLGEANAHLKRRGLPEARTLLRTARDRLQSGGTDGLRRWLGSLVAEFANAGGTLDEPEPRPTAPPPAAAAKPRTAPAPDTSTPAKPARPDPAATSSSARLARPRLILPARPTGRAGELLGLPIKIENEPVRLTMNGLPPGVTWLKDGTIRGRPARPGHYRVTITAESAGGVDSAVMSLSVEPASAPGESPPAAAAAPAPALPSPAPAPPLSPPVPEVPPPAHRPARVTPPAGAPPRQPERIQSIKTVVPPPPARPQPQPAPPAPVPVTQARQVAAVPPAPPPPAPRPAPAETPRPGPEAKPTPPSADDTVAATPKALPPGLAGDRFTLRLPNGRRLHVLAAARLCIGRGDTSDLAVAALARGNPTRTVAITREISRRHCEITLDGRGASLRDGWSDDGKASKFGTFLDESPVPTAATALASGQIVRITSQPPGPDCPHWRATRIDAGKPPRDAPTGTTATPATAAGTLHLVRLDDVPDDILLMQAACDLHACGITPGSCWLWHDDGQFRCLHDGRIESAACLSGLIPGATIDPPGPLRAHTVEELVRTAGAAH